MSSACSRVVPTGTVMRFSLVITLAMGMSKRVSKRRSRLVRMPTSFPFFVIGTPENLDFGIGGHSDRIDDHAAFRALYLVDLVRLLLNAQIAMDDSDPALLSNGDGHMGFSHRIHGGADDRNVQANVARQLGLSVGLCGHHVGVCGQQ